MSDIHDPTNYERDSLREQLAAVTKERDEANESLNQLRVCIRDEWQEGDDGEADVVVRVLNRRDQLREEVTHLRAEKTAWKLTAETHAEVIAELTKERDEADKMRGQALVELGIMQNQRDAAERHIAKEGRISDSEMMSLLRRVNRELEAERDQLREECERLKAERDDAKRTLLESSRPQSVVEELREELARLKAENERLREDGELLDWLDTLDVTDIYHDGGQPCSEHVISVGGEPIRDALRAARKL